MYNLILRDLYLAMYSSANFFYTSSFFILILVLLPFIFGTSIDQLQLLFKGILWVGLSLSIILTMERIFNTDYEDGNLDIILQKNSSLEIIIFAIGRAAILPSKYPMQAPILRPIQTTIEDKLQPSDIPDKVLVRPLGTGKITSAVNAPITINEMAILLVPAQANAASA